MLRAFNPEQSRAAEYLIASVPAQMPWANAYIVQKFILFVPTTNTDALLACHIL